MICQSKMVKFAVNMYFAIVAINRILGKNNDLK